MAGAKGRRWKCRGRPCSICGKWFVPHPRVGKRQKTCGSSDCKRELHQRARRAWRREHPDYDREERVRRRVRKGERAESGVDPNAQIDWLATREVAGVQVAVVIEEVSQMTGSWVRELVGAQVAVRKGKARQMPSLSAREEMAARTRPP